MFLKGGLLWPVVSFDGDLCNGFGCQTESMTHGVNAEK